MSESFFECFKCGELLVKVDSVSSSLESSVFLRHSGPKGVSCSTRVRLSVSDKYFQSKNEVISQEWVGVSAGPDAMISLIPWRLDSLVGFEEVGVLSGRMRLDSFPATIYQVPEWALTDNIVCAASQISQNTFQHNERFGLVTRILGGINNSAPRLLAIGSVLQAVKVVTFAREMVKQVNVAGYREGYCEMWRQSL